MILKYMALAWVWMSLFQLVAAAGANGQPEYLVLPIAIAYFLCVKYFPLFK